MRRALLALAGGAFTLLPAYTCGAPAGDDFVSTPDGDGVPFDGDPGPAPTGQRFDDVEVVDGCGRTHLAFRLVDEICGADGALPSPADLAAPMIRDGAFVDDTLYAVDGSALWVLGASNPTALVRRSLTAGVGEALAVAAAGDRVWLAEGDAGLVAVSTADPARPAIVDELALPGPAFDVAVDGDTGVIAAALGAAGLALVDQALPPVPDPNDPGADGERFSIVDVGGPAVSVTLDGGRAYVATCDGLVIVDVAGREVLGAARGDAFVPGAVVDGVNEAPAKDVAVVGSLAFVAAGRAGVVAVDVGDAASPRAVGQCTDAHALDHYVNGVKVDDGRLVVAAGEAGVDVVEDPLATCGDGFAASVDVSPPLPVVDAACRPVPPWSILDVVSWEPPPLFFDPVQLVVHDGHAWSFGDARRNGVRAVDVWTLPDVTHAGRYQEPRRVSGIAARDGVVALAGVPAPDGGAGSPGSLWIETDDDRLLVKDTLADTPWLQGTPGLLRDGTPVSVARGTLLVGHTDDHGLDTIDGKYASPYAIPLPEQVSPRHLVIEDDGRLDVAVPDGVASVSPGAIATGSATGQRLDALGRTAALAPDIAGTGDDVVVAAPEWANALGLSGAAYAAPGAFTADEILDVALWRTGPPRRVLAADPEQLGVVLEAAAIADRGALIVHGGVCAGAVPPAPYVDAVLRGDRAYLLAADVGRMRSELVRVDVGGARPLVLGVNAFTGSAVGMTTTADRLYVADADGAIRVYALPGATLLGVVGGAP